MVHYLLMSKSTMKKKKQILQTTMDMLLKRVTLSQEEPQAGPSGGVPEEGIVLTGDHGV